MKKNDTLAGLPAFIISILPVSFRRPYMHGAIRRVCAGEGFRTPYA